MRPPMPRTILLPSFLHTFFVCQLQLQVHSAKQVPSRSCQTMSKWSSWLVFHSEVSLQAMVRRRAHRQSQLE